MPKCLCINNIKIYHNHCIIIIHIGETIIGVRPARLRPYKILSGYHSNFITLNNVNYCVKL